MKKIISVLIAVLSLSIIISCTTPNNSADINNSNEVNDDLNQNDETKQEPIDDSEKKYESFVLCENFEGSFKDFKLNEKMTFDVYIEDVPADCKGCSIFIKTDDLYVTFGNNYHTVICEIENIDGEITIHKSTLSKNARNCSAWFIKNASLKQTSEGITITIYFVY